jgi:flagellar biosynthesis protein FliR
MLINVAQIQLFVLALSRILALIIQVPILGGQNIPAQTRIALGVVLTIILVPWQPMTANAQTLDLIGLAIGIFKEVLIGTLAGFAANLTFAAIQITGDVMGLGSGFESSRVFNPSMSEAGSVFNQLFVMVAMMIFLVMDGHHLFIIAMQKTFVAVPLNGAIPLTSANALISMTSQLILAGIQLGLPIFVALALADLALGFLARVAPQVQIFFLGMPMKVGIALYGLGMFFLVAIPVIRNLFQPIGNRAIQLLVTK